MHQPPHIGVNPTFVSDRNELNMPTASGYGGTTTAGSLVNSNSLGSNIKLSVTGVATNPLLHNGQQQQQQQANHQHRPAPLNVHPHFAPTANSGTNSHLTSPAMPFPPTPMLQSSAGSATTASFNGSFPTTTGAAPSSGRAPFVDPSSANGFLSTQQQQLQQHVRFAAQQLQQQQQQRAPSSNVMMPSSSSSSGGGVPPPQMRDALVHNLKKQVACLELECKFLKEKLANVNNTNNNGAAVVVQHHYGNSISNTNPASSTSASSGNAYTPSKTDALIRRANELEAEVHSLRNRFAEREQQHQVEMAMVRAETEAAVFAALTNGKNAVNAANGARLIDAKEVETLKELHAREVVALQKRIEHLDYELKYQYSEGGGGGGAADGTNMSSVSSSSNGDGGHSSSHGRGHSREAMAADIARFKQQLRNFETDNQTLKLQHDALLKDFAANQSLLVASESVNGDLRREVETLKERLTALSEGRINDLEKQIKDAHAAEVNKHYEMQQAKAEAEKLRHDLKEAIEAKLTAESAVRRAQDAKNAAEAELIAAKGVARDVTSQRDKLSADLSSLLLKHTQLEVKCQQQSQKLDAEGHSLTVLEKQYCTVLDDLEAVKRHARAKEEIYKGFDGTDNQFRAQLLLLRQDRDSFKAQFERLSEEYEILSKKYAAIEGYAKQQAAEEKLRGALAMIGHTKDAMQTLLQTQMKLSSDISSAVGDIPDLRTVLNCPYQTDSTAHENHGDRYPNPHHPPQPLAAAMGNAEYAYTAAYASSQAQQQQQRQQLINSNASVGASVELKHHEPSPAFQLPSSSSSAAANPSPSSTAAAFNPYYAAPTADSIMADLDRRAQEVLAGVKESSKASYIPVEADTTAPADIYPPAGYNSHNPNSAAVMNTTAAPPLSPPSMASTTAENSAAVSVVGHAITSALSGVGAAAAGGGGGEAYTPSVNSEEVRRELAALTERINSHEANLANVLNK